LPAGAPIGNKNGAKQRLVEQALIRAIKQRDLEAGDGETLRKIAEAMLDRALKGDPLGFDRIADRLDGKPAQQLQHTGADDGPVLHKIVREVTALAPTPRSSGGGNDAE